MRRWIIVLLILGFSTVLMTAEQEIDRPAIRKKAQKLYNDGNYQEAYDLFYKLVMDPETSPLQVGQDLNQSHYCLQNLNKVPEIDALLEDAVKAHPATWQLLQAAAQLYLNNSYHYGVMVAGEFQRGPQRGGQSIIYNSYERDRVRALQLMQQALPGIVNEKSQNVRASFYSAFATMLLGNRGYQGAWRLQYKTDLEKLPDYEEGWGYGYYGYQSQRFAPVDADGDPVYHTVPSSFEEAASDGERWRYMLMMQMELSDAYRQSSLQQYADFLHAQFGVQTMANYGWNYSAGDDNSKDREGGIMALHTLEDNETVARLAAGIKRFAIPDEHNFIRLYEQLGNNNVYALQKLSQIYMNRRQYKKAVPILEEIVRQWPNNYHGKNARNQLDQIRKPWGIFEGGKPQPAGEGAVFQYRYRNGEKVIFTAHTINIEKLLNEVKAYLKNNPRKLNWSMMDIGNIGHRLVTQNQLQYIEKQVAHWSLDLEPRENHFDRRITVTTPLQKAGAYLIEAKMADGNQTWAVVWVADTVIASKPFDGDAWYYVADAVSGKPLPNAEVEFFGYQQEYIRNNVQRKLSGRQYRIYTNEFAKKTDADGQLRVSEAESKKNKRGFTYVAIARHQGRLAYLGFRGIWYNRYYEQEYNQRKTYIISDRPVYRPGQNVKFKVWTSQVRYEIDDTSAYAGQQFSVRIQNPKGEEIYSEMHTADKYGGIEGELKLPKDATLGNYRIWLHRWGGNLNFRVEEYKKPEFQVTIEAPTEPVMLGETIPVKIKADYYFGAPVVNAKVKLKVTRSNHDARWYPSGIWDWFYGRGYWWFGYDYHWYPGWYRWGCFAPYPWWHHRQQQQPEIVLEQETFIKEDGTVEIQIDTAIAKELHGDKDHKYSITAEVRDESRRTIIGTGQVLVAREPFKVYAWIDRGYYNVGETINANFLAQTLDNKPVIGKGKVTLYRISYDDGQPQEKAVHTVDLDPNDEGRAKLKMQTGEAGQYRISYSVTDARDHTIEGGYIFVIREKGFESGDFRFNKLELIPDKKEYAPGDKLQLLINADKRDATVLMFLRPINGCYRLPQVVKLDGKSKMVEVDITKADMPNFFIEAITIYDGELHTVNKEIVVPPEKRVINVEVTTSSQEYKPGEKATVSVKLTDTDGEPFTGSIAMTVYDKAVEYISGGSNVPEIKEFFWKWRRRHNPNTISSLQRYFGNLLKAGQTGMQNLGVFGHTLADMDEEHLNLRRDGGAMRQERGMALNGAAPPQPTMAAKSMVAEDMAPGASIALIESAGFAYGKGGELREDKNEAGQGQPEMAEAAVRKNFADTAYWNGAIITDENGQAQIELDMPENLSSWKVRTWAIGKGPRVGEGTVEVVTTKDLLLRLQAPRFFVEKDEVVLSANIHNYLDTAKQVTAVLELEGNTLESLVEKTQQITIEANGEKRVDWRIKVKREGTAVIRMKALTDEESDAMQMEFPVKVHGMMKMDSFSGHMRPERVQSYIMFKVPAERRINESRLEVRYSPTLAGAMVDALPYLVSYPYGCTEQTLNRFVPTVITQKVLMDMNLDLKAIRDKRSNLNAQEIGDDKERAEQWKRGGWTAINEKGELIWTDNPVFSKEVVNDMVQTGIIRLSNMQVSDGGWGWFSGWGERSYPHTTATVVHGLQVARENDAMVPENVLQRGVDWLTAYQNEQVKKLENAPTQTKPWKNHADNLDALVFMVLTDANVKNVKMQEFLYRDRNHMSVYGKCTIGLAFHSLGLSEQVTMIKRNIEQYLVKDEENQTAYLRLANGGYWWYWYGSEYEAHSYYLKLLARTEPKGETAPWLVKYLLNNRKHATYWKSTRDTALCIEAFADYMRASEEDKPDMTLRVFLDGTLHKKVQITKENIFTFDNKLVLTGKAVTSGSHKLEFRREGKGPLYYNAYVSYFSLEDFITKAGLEVKVNRRYFKLIPVDKHIKAAGSHGQVTEQKVEKYERQELKNFDAVTSGDLVEIELIIESKNDYEYVIFEDMKASGFEADKVQSGYVNNGMHAYMELRDDRISFFVRRLPRGKHSMTYQMRAEIPGKFSALPAKAYAMYAPELKGNSDELKIVVEDEGSMRPE